MTHHSYHSTHNRAAPVQHMKQCKTVPDPQHNPRHQILTKLQGLTSNNTMQLKVAPINKTWPNALIWTHRKSQPRAYQYSQGKKWFSWMIQMIFLLWKIQLKINRKKPPRVMCVTWELSNLSFIKKQGATNKMQ
jgi:hypothetical protein